MEQVARTENASVLGIKAKHQTYAQGVEALEGFRCVRMGIAATQRIIDNADQLARFQRDLHLLLDVLVTRVHQEV